ncbi:MAG: molybdopterin dinucleotide binding domain-containing protein [Microthrixaceae bacterium]
MGRTRGKHRDLCRRWSRRTRRHSERRWNRDHRRAATTATVEAPHVSPTSAYSLRLVVNRKLYDAGASISRCDSSSALAPAQALRLSPADASPLGLKDLDRVSVTSPNGSLSARVALDSSVPKGTAVLVHNLAEADPGALVASDDAVCEIRVEVG